MTDLYKCPSYYGPVQHVSSGLNDPSQHKARKFITHPLFTGKTLSDFSTTFMNNHLQTLLSELSKCTSRKEEPVNMTLHLSGFANDIMFSYLMDKDFSYQKRSSLQAVHDNTRVFNAIDLATLLR
jgi:hypothetical protein